MKSAAVVGNKYRTIEAGVFNVLKICAVVEAVLKFRTVAGVRGVKNE